MVSLIIPFLFKRFFIVIMNEKYSHLATGKFNNSEHLIFNGNDKYYLKNNQNIRIYPIDILSVEEEFVRTVERIVHKNISNYCFNLEILAEELNLSKSTLQRKFKNVFSMTPNNYIKMVRIMHSRLMFENHIGSVLEISTRVGFRDVKYFSRCFKSAFGKSPAEILKCCKEQRNNSDKEQHFIVTLNNPDSTIMKIICN